MNRCSHSNAIDSVRLQLPIFYHFQTIYFLRFVSFALWSFLTAVFDESIVYTHPHAQVAVLSARFFFPDNSRNGLARFFPEKLYQSSFPFPINRNPYPHPNPFRFSRTGLQNLFEKNSHSACKSVGEGTNCTENSIDQRARPVNR